MDKKNPQWSRRHFITTATAAGTAILINPQWTWAATQTDPRIAAIVAKTMGIDTHNHIDVPLDRTKIKLQNPTALRDEMTKSGLSAICMTFAVDYQELKNPGDAYTRFLNGISEMDDVLKINKMKRALNFLDLKSAHGNKQPTVIQSVEGAHFMEGKLDRLEIAYKRGLRHLGLLHDHDASVPLGDVFTNPAQFGGLTPFGVDVIKACNRLGILVDLSHGTDEMVNLALKVATKPVLVSHTGLNTQLGQNENMAKMMRSRLISKEQAKIVANAGGVIGVWTHLAETPLEYAQNIRAMVDAAGIEHVCIGTDTKLTSAFAPPREFRPPPPQNPPIGNGTPPNDKQGQSKPADDKKQKMNGGTNETWENQKTGFYYTVVEVLLKTGFNEDEIAKIGGGNFGRIFKDATS